MSRKARPKVVGPRLNDEFGRISLAVFCLYRVGAAGMQLSGMLLVTRVTRGHTHTGPPACTVQPSPLTFVDAIDAGSPAVADADGGGTMAVATAVVVGAEGGGAAAGDGGAADGGARRRQTPTSI